MSDREVLWSSNEGTRVYRAAAGEPLLMRRVGRRKKQMDLTVSKAGITIAEEFIPLEEISDVTSRTIISFHAVYFVEILLNTGELLLVYHISEEGTLSETPRNLDTYLLLVALYEIRNMTPPPFEIPKTHGTLAIRLILFWGGFTIAAVLIRSVFLLSLSAIPLFFSGYLILKDGLNYRNYEGGRNLAWAGAVLAILGMFLFILTLSILGAI